MILSFHEILDDTVIVLSLYHSITEIWIVCIRGATCGITLTDYLYNFYAIYWDFKLSKHWKQLVQIPCPGNLIFSAVGERLQNTPVARTIKASLLYDPDSWLHHWILIQVRCISWTWLLLAQLNVNDSCLNFMAVCTSWTTTLCHYIVTLWYDLQQGYMRIFSSACIYIHTNSWIADYHFLLVCNTVTSSPTLITPPKWRGISSCPKQAWAGPNGALYDRRISNGPNLSTSPVDWSTAVSLQRCRQDST